MRVAIVGYGKMGHEIEKVLCARGHRVVAIIDKDNRADMGSAEFQGADVAIEFSAPDAAFDNICDCLEAGVAVVSGTTAWLDRYNDVAELCRARRGRFFYASNYSIGMNLFFRTNKQLASMMNRFSQYDVTIEEVHHTEKKDAPSGTAITIAEGILSKVDRKMAWHLGYTCEPDELGVAAIRRSVVPGTHTVTWESEADMIELRHTAKNRAGLAVGAVIAAEFLVAQPSGVYTMEDLLLTTKDE